MMSWQMAGGTLIPRQKTTIGVDFVPVSDLIMTLLVVRPREALKSTPPLRLTMSSPHRERTSPIRDR